jgi:hypothetical protein
VRDGQIELAPPELLERRRRLDLVHRDLDVGVRRREAFERARQHLASRTLEDPDAEPAAVVAPDRSEVVAGGIEQVAQCGRSTAQLLTRVREADHATIALDQPRPALPFERRDLLRNRRRREREHPRGAGEAPLPYHCVEHEQPARIDRRQLF